MIQSNTHNTYIKIIFKDDDIDSICLAQVEVVTVSVRLFLLSVMLGLFCLLFELY